MTTNTIQQKEIISDYYSARIKLRDIYEKSDLNELLDNIKHDIYKHYKSNIIESISLNGYSLNINFKDKKYIIENTINTIKSIVIDDIKQLYKVDLEYIDHFILGSDLVILI